ncbi:MAG: MBOAT family protein [Romboutsia sp.]|nr:MBOAT family protein [Romboutsia sp.]
MVFSSTLFLFYFLPIFLLLYYIVPFKFKNFILLIFSLLFYSWGEPTYIVLMIFSSIVDYSIGLIIDKYRYSYISKIGLISSIFINIGLLSFFKYSDFLILNINNIFNSNIELLNLPLPIGISFYTFQTMSYSIDVYRNEVPAQRNFLSFATYVTLFPQLIAGPIVRYETVHKELNSRSINIDMLYDGITRFVIGLCKKIIIANNVGFIWTQIKSLPSNEISALTAWLGIICFSLQIYFDFSGYSDMAIGLGKMLGFNFLENFDYPYISKSITEFWRRWHISLGYWFRDYVYIPLGGNRKGKSRWVLNIFIVWFLTGLWHGASYNFIAWGLYFGILLMFEKLFLSKILEKMPNIFRHLYVILIVIISWIIFELSSLSSIYNYIGLMFNNNVFMDEIFLYYFIPNIILLCMAILSCTPIIKKILYRYEYLKILFIIIGLILCTSFLIDASFNPFLYFRF